MGRTTVYNNITNQENISKINKKNIELMNDFLDYLISTDRSKGTVNGYKNDLLIFFCWNLSENEKNDYINDQNLAFANRFDETTNNYWDGWTTTVALNTEVKSPLSSDKSAKVTLAAMKNANDEFISDAAAGCGSVGGAWSTIDMGLFGKTVNVLEYDYIEFAGLAQNELTLQKNEFFILNNIKYSELNFLYNLANRYLNFINYKISTIFS